MKIHYIIISILILSLTSCITPRPISQLTPNSGPTTWNFGKETIFKTNKNIKASITFIKGDGNDLIFEVEVSNNSLDTVLLAPELLYYTVLSNDNVETETKIYAINPEEILLDFDKRLSKENANITENLIHNMVQNTTEIATTMVSKEPILEEDNINTYSQDESELQLLNNQRDFWEYQTLRKTSLPPKSSIHGKIFFKRTIDANVYKIHLPVNQDIFIFDFKQKLITP